MKKILYIFIIVTLTSCTSMSTSLNDFMGLEKGMTRESATESIKNNTFKEFNIKKSGTTYNIISYEVLISKFKKTETYYSPNGMRDGKKQTMQTSASDKPYTETTTEMFTSQFYLVFKNDILMTWGFLYELQRDNDSELNEIAELINENK